MYDRRKTKSLCFMSAPADAVSSDEEDERPFSLETLLCPNSSLPPKATVAPAPAPTPAPTPRQKIDLYADDGKGEKVAEDFDMANFDAPKKQNRPKLARDDELLAFIASRQRFAIWTEADLAKFGARLEEARGVSSLRTARLVPSRAPCVGKELYLQDLRGITHRLTEYEDDAGLDELLSLPDNAVQMSDAIVDDGCTVLLIKPAASRKHVSHLLARMVITICLKRRKTLKSSLPSFEDVPKPWRYASLWASKKANGKQSTSDEDLQPIGELSIDDLFGSVGAKRIEAWYKTQFITSSCKKRPAADEMPLEKKSKKNPAAHDAPLKKKVHWE